MIGVTNKAYWVMAASALFLAPPLVARDSCDLLGEVFAANPFDTALRIKGDNSADINTVPLSNATHFQRVTVNHALAGDFDRKNLQSGDRVCVQFGKSKESAARILVMRRSDIQEQQKRVLSAVALNTAFGTVTDLNPELKTIGLDEARAAGGTKHITLDASDPVAFRRFASGAQGAEDAATSSWGQLRVGDQIYAEGKRNANGRDMRAGVIILGGVRGVAGTIAAINGVGAIDLHEVSSGLPLTVDVRTDSVFRVSPFVEEATTEESARGTVAWDLHPIGFADLQEGDTISVLVKAGPDVVKAGDDAHKMTALMVVTGFGAFGVDAPPSGTPIFWLLDPLKLAK